MPNDFIQTRLSGVGFRAADIDAKAAKLGMTRSGFILRAVSLLLNLDIAILGKIQRYREGLNIPEWLVMQNMLIKEMAQGAVEVEVWGRKREVLEEFISVNDGTGPRTLTGEELYNTLKKIYKQREEQKKVELLIAAERDGRPLDDKDKALLIRHRRGSTWLESDEYLQEQRRKAEIERLIKEHGLDDGEEEGEWGEDT